MILEYAKSLKPCTGSDKTKIATVVGARPQFIKCAPVSRLIRECHQEIIIHTGQHYDEEMSDIFFKELGIPKPEYNLGVGSGTHGEQTAKMLVRIEYVLIKEQPDIVMVYGDTNSTVAGALAAAKLNIPLAHVEAGLRSFDRTMPEEINRIVTDHLSITNFSPTYAAVTNLKNEGITGNVFLVGDTTTDAMIMMMPIVWRSDILNRLNLAKKQYCVMTLHRPSNTDTKDVLSTILNTISGVSNLPIIFPCHPRTRESIFRNGLIVPANIIVVPPMGYTDMLCLMKHAYRIFTDSGGMQKEAYNLGTPCITLRDTTEWPETVNTGWNTLAGTDPDQIKKAFDRDTPFDQITLYDTGASRRIVEILNGMNGDAI